MRSLSWMSPKWLCQRPFDGPSVGVEPISQSLVRDSGASAPLGHGQVLASELNEVQMRASRDRFAVDRLAVAVVTAIARFVFSRSAGNKRLATCETHGLSLKSAPVAVTRRRAEVTLRARAVLVAKAAIQTVEPILRMMQVNVLNVRRAQFKVFWSVVAGVAIAVVDRFARSQRPAKHLCHHKTVSILIPAFGPDQCSAAQGSVVVPSESTPRYRFSGAIVRTLAARHSSILQASGVCVCRN